MAKQARRHKVGKAHMMHVISNCPPRESTRITGETELSWVGIDDRGLELHIVAVVTTDDRTAEEILLVIHCFPTVLKG
ncbi:MAG: hypothetical protein Q4D89_05780 [Arachnia propionica]|uniref:hypothetical protein n=1 Tax=Arachnia propionica TaxID=1750 RepID=UPI00270EDA4D|nr:hypothetical protein [Arachnia propionica]